MKAKIFFGAIINVLKAILRNWREILGWIVIVVFAYLYVFEVNTVWWLKGRTFAFPFLLATTALLLCWLKLNAKKQ